MERLMLGDLHEVADNKLAMKILRVVLSELHCPTSCLPDDFYCGECVWCLADKRLKEIKEIKEGESVWFKDGVAN